MVLAEYLFFKVLFKLFQLFNIRPGSAFGRNTSHARDHGLNIPDRCNLAAFFRFCKSECSPHFVDNVNGLVRQKAIVDVTGRQLGGCLESGK